MRPSNCCRNSSEPSQSHHEMRERFGRRSGVKKPVVAYKVHEPVHGWGVLAAVRLRHSLQSLVEEPLWRSVSIPEQANEPEQRETFTQLAFAVGDC
jgi:hypothetical protein